MGKDIDIRKVKNGYIAYPFQNGKSYATDVPGEIMVFETASKLAKWIEKHFAEDGDVIEVG